MSFESNLSNVLGQTTDGLHRAAEIIGGMAESYAKQEITRVVYDTPESPNYVRTGHLRNSITYKVRDEGSSVVVTVGSAMEYAPYVELGTGRNYEKSGGHGTFEGMKPRPYLRPAIENHKEQYKAVLKAELSKP